MSERLIALAQAAVDAYEDRFESLEGSGNYTGPIDEEMKALAAALSQPHAEQPSQFDIDAVRNQLAPSVWALAAFDRILAAQPHASAQEAAPNAPDWAIRAGVRAFQSGHNGFDDLSDWRAFYRTVSRLLAPHAPAPVPGCSICKGDPEACDPHDCGDAGDAHPAPVQAAPTEPDILAGLRRIAKHADDDGTAAIHIEFLDRVIDEIEDMGKAYALLFAENAKLRAAVDAATPAPVAAPAPVPPLQGAEAAEIDLVDALMAESGIAAPLHAVGGRRLTDEQILNLWRATNRDVHQGDILNTDLTMFARVVLRAASGEQAPHGQEVAREQEKATEGATYTTTPGESLMGIALRQLKNESRWKEIRNLNADRFGMMAPHEYYPVGTALKMPAPSSQAAKGDGNG